MSNKYKLSVVILVYNTSEYLRDCIESILNQTLDSIEIIAVDDDSTDDSLEILKTYEHLENFKIIHQENQGGAIAGNTGLKQATGEYVTLMDSDDILPTDAHERLYTFAKENNCEIVIGAAKRLVNGYLVDAGYVEERNVWKKDRIVENYKDDINIFYDGFYWNKIYKRELIINNNIFMPPGMLFADRPFTHKAYIYANRIGIIEKVVYYWRKRADNAVQKSVLQGNNDVRNLLDRFESLEYQINYFDELINDEKFKNEFLKQYIGRNFYCILDQIFDNAQIRDVFFTKMKEFLGSINDVYHNNLPMKLNILIYLVLNDFTHEFIYLASKEHNGKILTEDGKRYWCLPYFRNEAIGVPDELYLVNKFEPKFIKINKVECFEDHICIKDFNYISGEILDHVSFRVRSKVDESIEVSFDYDDEAKRAIIDISSFGDLEVLDFYAVISYYCEEYEVRLTKNMIQRNGTYCNDVFPYYTNNGYFSISIFKITLNQIELKPKSLYIQTNSTLFENLDMYIVNRQFENQKIKLDKIENKKEFSIEYDSFLSTNSTYDLYFKLIDKFYRVPFNVVENICNNEMKINDIELKIYSTVKENLSLRSEKKELFVIKIARKVMARLN